MEWSYLLKTASNFDLTEEATLEHPSDGLSLNALVLPILSCKVPGSCNMRAVRPEDPPRYDMHQAFGE